MQSPRDMVPVRIAHPKPKDYIILRTDTQEVQVDEWWEIDTTDGIQGCLRACGV